MQLRFRFDFECCGQRDPVIVVTQNRYHILGSRWAERTKERGCLWMFAEKALG